MTNHINFHFLILGYELIATTIPLAERPSVDRLEPLNAKEFSSYLDGSGRIIEVDKLKRRVFKGVS